MTYHYTSAINHLKQYEQQFHWTDGINIRDLKHLMPFAIRYPTNMYNTALNTNTIPHLWKCAIIIPILKPNKDYNIGTKYQPISLPLPISKTLEKTLLPYITENIPEISHQHGFKYNTQHTQLCTTSTTKSQKVSTIKGLYQAL